MARPIKPFQIVEVLQWKYENNASQFKTAKHFGIDRRTIKSWADKYDLDELKSEYSIKREFQTRSVTVEKRIPDQVKAMAEKTLNNLHSISFQTSEILQLWVGDIHEIATKTNDGVKNLKPWQLDRLIKLQEKLAPYTVPTATGLVEDTTTLYETIKQKLGEAAQLLRNERDKKIKQI